MKDKLTIEQSQRLIELGVNQSRASATRYNISETEVYCGYAREIVVTDGYITDYVSQEPIFTLADILSLLPKEIEAPDYWGEVDTCSLGITTNNDVWEVSYYGVDNVFRKAPELIDALYTLLVWAIENDYLNLKEK